MSKISNGNDAAVLVTEYVKCRSLPNNNGRSPVGTLFIYEDRVVWRDENDTEGVTVDFSVIRGQKVSPPNKSKTQLQLCLHEGLGEPATFAFVNPTGGQEGHVKERDLVKDTLQQLLLKYRAVANAEAKKANQQQAVGGHLQQKERLLSENPRLQALYRDLVTTNLISPKEFWAEYVDKPIDDGSEQKIGVSGGFLSNVKKTDGCNGLKLNLTSDTIQAIFRTYPVVEQKHLELVPHEMTEQEFWRKFFQSHYFHRDRAANVNPTEVFADCLKVDESDMKALVEAGVSSRNLDLDRVRDDIGLAGNDDADSQQKKSNANKALLVKRFNYHSGRVLRACLGEEGASSSSTIGSSLPQTSSATRVNDDTASAEPPTKKSKLDDATTSQRILLDSSELADDIDRQVGLPLNIDAFTKLSSESDVFSDDLSARLKQTIQHSLPLPHSDLDSIIDARDAQSAVLECSSGGNLWPVASVNVLPKGVLSQLETLHYALSELLRHFWCCFPPKTPELERKLERMIETLQKFEATKLTPAVVELGKQNTDHLLSMLNSAYTRFDSYRQRKSGQKPR